MRKLFDVSTLIVLALATLGGVIVWRRGGWDEVWHVFIDDLDLFIGILPKVLAGCLIGALIRLLLPRETVNRWIGGDSGLTGLLIATMAGIILPGGPFTIYPIAASLYATGAGMGPVVAFVTSWTMLGFNRALIWELPFFGPQFVSWRVLASLPLPLLAGFLAALADQALRRRNAA